MTPSQSAVSVIIPARDAEATIGPTLKSLAPDIWVIGEVLLVDDGSEDETVDVARASASSQGLPLSVVPATAGGAGAARNAGLAAAQHTLVFFLDADDRVEPAGISVLHNHLAANATAGLAIGAHIRRTDGRPDKLKTPDGYGADRRRNVRDYLLGRRWPIAMGSALFRRQAAAGIWFPEQAALDEDTCFWAELMARTAVVAVESTILIYELNEARMARRYSATPRQSFVAIAGALNRLASAIDERQAVQWRKAWVALRIARQLIHERRYDEAKGMLRAVAAHPAFARSRRLARYRLRVAAGAARNRTPKPTARSAHNSERFRTLAITADAAWPPVSGADLRNAQNAIAASMFGPVVLTSIGPSLTQTQPPPGIEVEPMAGAPTNPDKHRQAGFETRITEVAACLTERIEAFRPDAIIVEGVHLSSLMPQLRMLAPLVILDMHNIESMLHGQVDLAP